MPVYLDSKAGNEEDQLLSDLTSEDVQGVKTRLPTLFYLMSNDVHGVKTRLLTDVCVCMYVVGASFASFIHSLFVGRKNCAQ